jgi:hypothetical protein
MSFCKRVNYLHHRIWGVMLSAICWFVFLCLLCDDHEALPLYRPDVLTSNELLQVHQVDEIYNYQFPTKIVTPIVITEQTPIEA